MELRAAIEGLRHVKPASRVKIYSDSDYLIDTMNKGWLSGWEKNGWNKADKKPVKNVDLWRELLEAVGPHEVEWVKVRGHSGAGPTSVATRWSSSPYAGATKEAPATRHLLTSRRRAAGRRPATYPPRQLPGNHDLDGNLLFN